MKAIYQSILTATASGHKLLAVLIDPDKMPLSQVPAFIEKVNQSVANYIFVGGSTVKVGATNKLVSLIKRHTFLPVVLFPGDVTQISPAADGLLFLSLISGRNPHYLIGQQVASVAVLRPLKLEVIPTGYLLVESGATTAVQSVTNTLPLSLNKVDEIIDTAKAGELLGMKLIYLEAGSGAVNAIPDHIIHRVKNELNVPLIVGGGIKNITQLNAAYQAGADMVVIGTAFETSLDFFETLKKESSYK